MALKKFNPITPGQRGLVIVDRSGLHKGDPVKKLTEGLHKTGGRNNSGHVTAWQRGGGHKRKYRFIDFSRSKSEPAIVHRLEYDPNRTAFISLLKYEDGEHRYIISPKNIKIGEKIISGEFLNWKNSAVSKLNNRL